MARPLLRVDRGPVAVAEAARFAAHAQWNERCMFVLGQFAP